MEEIMCMGTSAHEARRIFYKRLSMGNFDVVSKANGIGVDVRAQGTVASGEWRVASGEWRVARNDYKSHA
jgi:hypothetical protein